MEIALDQTDEKQLAVFQQQVDRKVMLKLVKALVFLMPIMDKVVRDSDGQTTHAEILAGAATAKQALNEAIEAMQKEWD